MLRRCGFGGELFSWIAHCISMVRFSILVNDTPTCFFNSSGGLRQGDLLSPLLFVIVMEALSMMISTAVSKGLLFRFSVGTVIDISRLLFADDTLIFNGAHRDHLHHPWCFFLCFEAVLGLKVNLAKLELALVGDVADVDGLTCIMGCGVSLLPLKYIGLPLEASYKAKSI
jgi:hypothetical protein